jgi:hypothetical protein
LNDWKIKKTTQEVVSAKNEVVSGRYDLPSYGRKTSVRDMS